MKKSRSKNHPYCLFSISEVAWLLRTDESCVRWAIHVGMLPVVRRRRYPLIPAYALTDLVNHGEPCTGPLGRGGAR